MKRFYKEVAARPAEGGFEILLDSKTVKTPARAALILPNDRLAEAVVEEWRAQDDEIDPRKMPFTGLANAAIDHIVPDPAAFARSLARYGENDLLCYRADHPDALVQRQAEAWDMLLDWARQRFDIRFEIVPGIMHRPQPPATLERLDQAVAAYSPFQLAGLSPLVTIGGSLITALALAEYAVALAAAWDAVSLDEVWQAEQWGADAEAALLLEARAREFAAGYGFLRLL